MRNAESKMNQKEMEVETIKKASCGIAKSIIERGLISQNTLRANGFPILTSVDTANDLVYVSVVLDINDLNKTLTGGSESCLAVVLERPYDRVSVKDVIEGNTAQLWDDYEMEERLRQSMLLVIDGLEHVSDKGYDGYEATFDRIPFQKVVTVLLPKSVRYLACQFDNLCRVIIVYEFLYYKFGIFSDDLEVPNYQGSLEESGINPPYFLHAVRLPTLEDMYEIESS